jgi:hypothetical protein
MQDGPVELLPAHHTHEPEIMHASQSNTLPQLAGDGVNGLLVTDGHCEESQYHDA